MAELLHRFELRVAVITAVTLLFAQLGAMTHSYSHSTDITPPSVHKSMPGTRDLCGGCLSFAPLLSLAGTPAALPFIETQSRSPGIHAYASSLVDQHLHLAFRSRAPPLTPGF